MKIIDSLKGVKRFAINVWAFRLTLWHHRRWDYGSYFVFLKDFTDDLQRLEHTMSGPRWDKKMKRAKVIGFLADRIMNEKYLTDKFKYDMDVGEEDELGHSVLHIHTTPIHDFPVSTGHVHKMKLEEQDFEMMQTLIKKHIRTFWD